MSYYSFETQITPLTMVRRERMLPVPGDVLVRIGDRVEPTQVVARANLPGDFRIVPVARPLGVPTSQVERHMRVSLGDEVQRGQLIAKRGRLFAYTVKSPLDGMVTASGGGRVLIEASPTPFDLRAYIYGTVSNMIQHYGVIIETPGAVIQGVWEQAVRAWVSSSARQKAPMSRCRPKRLIPRAMGRSWSPELVWTMQRSTVRRNSRYVALWLVDCHRN